jgi:hypothetical protein
VVGQSFKKKPDNRVNRESCQYTIVKALAADRKGWAARVRQIDPVDHNTAASMVTSSLDASAEEWRKGAKIHICT